jgi:hypothetical protein
MRGAVRVPGAVVSAMLEDMEATSTEKRSVDVTGLSDEAIQAVESLVAAFREQANGTSGLRSPGEWCEALREWAVSHQRPEHAAEWGRDSIYAGRGE